VHLSPSTVRQITRTFDDAPSHELRRQLSLGSRGHVYTGLVRLIQLHRQRSVAGPPPITDRDALLDLVNCTTQGAIASISPSPRIWASDHPLLAHLRPDVTGSRRPSIVATLNCQLLRSLDPTSRHFGYSHESVASSPLRMGL